MRRTMLTAAAVFALVAATPSFAAKSLEGSSATGGFPTRNSTQNNNDTKGFSWCASVLANTRAHAAHEVQHCRHSF